MTLMCIITGKKKHGIRSVNRNESTKLVKSTDKDALK